MFTVRQIHDDAERDNNNQYNPPTINYKVENYGYDKRYRVEQLNNRNPKEAEGHSFSTSFAIILSFSSTIASNLEICSSFCANKVV